MGCGCGGSTKIDMTKFEFYKNLSYEKKIKKAEKNNKKKSNYKKGKLDEFD